MAENTGAGKIEAGGPGNVGEISLEKRYLELILIPLPQYTITGLPTSINPDTNPPVQRFVNVPEGIQNFVDIDYYFDGITEIKLFNDSVIVYFKLFYI